MKRPVLSVVAIAVLATATHALAQQPAHGATSAASSVPPANRTVPTGATLPAGYVIGTSDVLSIVFWRDKDMSADVTVRPDGKISLPLLNEIPAAGYTPEELREKLIEAAGKLVQDPNATVVVKEVHSRNVFITGNVAKPASYPLPGEMTVLQLIAAAGGLLEYADGKNIVVIRNESGHPQYFKFNYKDVVNQRRTSQNIALKPGDTVVVP